MSPRKRYLRIKHAVFCKLYLVRELKMHKNKKDVVTANGKQPMDSVFRWPFPFRDSGPEELYVQLALEPSLTQNLISAIQ
jgi:hypothetical protein